MIDGKRVLGLITARGGSKGLPRKNVLPLAGKPLIAWTVEAARASATLSRVVLSSDDDDIIRVAEAFGCEVPFRRPARLAADDTPGIAPVLHALGELDGFDYVVLLQPTSPLRTAADIDGAVWRCVSSDAPSCVSVVAVNKPPQWMYTLGEGRLRPILSSGSPLRRRQDAAPVYALNGAVYVADVDDLRRTRSFVTDATVGYVMPPERSVDVDDELDLRWCAFLLTQQQRSHGGGLGRV